MTELTTGNQSAQVGRLLRFTSWLKSFGKNTPDAGLAQPQIQKIDPSSRLSSFVVQIEKSNPLRKGVIGYPLRELYGDFKNTIKSLPGLNEELKEKIATAFDDANLGVILRVIDKTHPAYRSNPRKNTLLNQLHNNLEPLVVEGDRTSVQASNQRDWIMRAASWDDLITGVFIKPEVVSSTSIPVPAGIASQLQNSNLDPDLLDK